MKVIKLTSKQAVQSTFLSRPCNLVKVSNKKVNFEATESITIPYNTGVLFVASGKIKTTAEEMILIQSVPGGGIRRAGVTVIPSFILPDSEERVYLNVLMPSHSQHQFKKGEVIAEGTVVNVLKQAEGKKDDVKT